MNTRADLPSQQPLLDLYRPHLENAVNFTTEPVARYQTRPQPDTYSETIDADYFLMVAECLLRVPPALLWLFCLATMMSLHYAGRVITTPRSPVCTQPEPSTMPSISTSAQSLFVSNIEPVVATPEKDNSHYPCMTK